MVSNNISTHNGFGDNYIDPKKQKKPEQDQAPSTDSKQTPETDLASKRPGGAKQGFNFAQTMPELEKQLSEMKGTKPEFSDFLKASLKAAGVSEKNKGTVGVIVNDNVHTLKIQNDKAKGKYYELGHGSDGPSRKYSKIYLNDLIKKKEEPKAPVAEKKVEEEKKAEPEKKAEAEKKGEPKAKELSKEQKEQVKDFLSKGLEKFGEFTDKIQKDLKARQDEKQAKEFAKQKEAFEAYMSKKGIPMLAQLGKDFYKGLEARQAETLLKNIQEQEAQKTADLVDQMFGAKPVVEDPLAGQMETIRKETLAKLDNLNEGLSKEIDAENARIQKNRENNERREVDFILKSTVGKAVIAGNRDRYNSRRLAQTVKELEAKEAAAKLAAETQAKQEKEAAAKLAAKEKAEAKALEQQPGITNISSGKLAALKEQTPQGEYKVYESSSEPWVDRLEDHIKQRERASESWDTKYERVKKAAESNRNSKTNRFAQRKSKEEKQIDDTFKFLMDPFGLKNEDSTLGKIYNFFN